MSRQFLPARLLAGCILLLVLLPAAASASYWEDYKKARDAVEAKDYDTAEQLIRQAIADTPEPKRRIAGRYIPYYYLGVILHEKGDCKAAMEAFATSDEFGIVRANSDESRDKARRKSRCEQLAADVEREATEVERALSEARGALARLDGRRSERAVAAAWSEGNPSLGSRRDQAESRLRKAESLVGEARRLQDPDKLRAVAREGEAVTALLDGLFGETTELLGRAGEARDAAAGDLVKAVRDARRSLDAAAPLAPYPPGLKKKIATLERRIQAAENVGEDDAAALEQRRRNLERAVRAVDAAAAPPPKALLEAAELYLAQAFQAAVDRLAGYEAENERERFHAALLQAAAHFQLHAQNPRSSQAPAGDLASAHLAAARDAVKVCLSFGPDNAPGRPAATLYPPSFLDFYAEIERDLAAQAEDDAEARPEDAGPSP